MVNSCWKGAKCENPSCKYNHFCWKGADCNLGESCKFVHPGQTAPPAAAANAANSTTATHATAASSPSPSPSPTSTATTANNTAAGSTAAPAAQPPQSALSFAQVVLSSNNGNSCSVDGAPSSSSVSSEKKVSADNSVAGFGDSAPFGGGGSINSSHSEGHRARAEWDSFVIGASFGRFGGFGFGSSNENVTNRSEDEDDDPYEVMKSLDIGSLGFDDDDHRHRNQDALWGTSEKQQEDCGGPLLASAASAGGSGSGETSLLQFLASANAKSSFFKSTPEAFCAKLVEEDVRTLKDLKDAVDDDDCLNDFLVACCGLKKFKRAAFKKSVIDAAADAGPERGSGDLATISRQQLIRLEELEGMFLSKRAQDTQSQNSTASKGLEEMQRPQELQEAVAQQVIVLKGESASLRDRLKASEELLEGTQRKHEQELARLREAVTQQIIVLRGESESFRDRLSASEAQLEEARNSHKREVLELRETAAMEVRSCHEKELSQVRETMAREAKTQLEEALLSHSRELLEVREALSRETSALKDENAALKDQLREETSSLKVQVQRLQEECSCLKGELLQAKQANVESRLQLRSLGEKNTGLKCELHKSDHLIHNLRNQLLAAEQAREGLRCDRTKLDQRIQELTKENKILSARLNSRAGEQNATQQQQSISKSQEAEHPSANGLQEQDGDNGPPASSRDKKALVVADNEGDAGLHRKLSPAVGYVARTAKVSPSDVVARAQAALAAATEITAKKREATAKQKPSELSAVVEEEKKAESPGDEGHHRPSAKDTKSDKKTVSYANVAAAELRRKREEEAKRSRAGGDGKDVARAWSLTPLKRGGSIGGEERASAPFGGKLVPLTRAKEEKGGSSGKKKTAPETKAEKPAAVEMAGKWKAAAKASSTIRLPSY